MLTYIGSGTYIYISCIKDKNIELCKKNTKMDQIIIKVCNSLLFLTFAAALNSACTSGISFDSRQQQIRHACDTSQNKIIGLLA